VAVSIGVGGAEGPINAPTVYNAMFNLAQFWDGRATDLQDQAGGPVENPIEMAATFPNVIAKLNQDEAFKAEFEAVYPQGFTKETITDAIAEFETTLVTPGSPYDNYLEGDQEALTDAQKRGLELYAKHGCAMCHVGEAMGGQSFEKMGRYVDYFADRGGEITEADLGRYNHTGEEKDKHKFKVPVLRNVEVTFPYFHDASTSDLGEAVRVMANVQMDKDLSQSEVDDLAAFLESLTGAYQGTPLDEM
jgi:cytochrome c peroxidase